MSVDDQDFPKTVKLEIDTTPEEFEDFIRKAAEKMGLLVGKELHSDGTIEFSLFLPKEDASN
jgi:hypothetical protein